MRFSVRRGSSRSGQPSAISLMVAGNVGAMAGGDAQRHAEIASLTGFTVAAFCVIVWILQLSVLVKLISDSILIGFKAGAGLTIAAGFTDRHMYCRAFEACESYDCVSAQGASCTRGGYIADLEARPLRIIRSSTSRP